MRTGGCCPAHGPHDRADRNCPGCWESDFERQRKPVPGDIRADANLQRVLHSPLNR